MLCSHRMLLTNLLTSYEKKRNLVTLASKKLYIAVSISLFHYYHFKCAPHISISKRLRDFFRNKINSLNQNTFDLLVSASVPHRWIISFFYTNHHATTTTTTPIQNMIAYIYFYIRVHPYRIIYFAMIIQYQIKENINLLKLPKDMCLVIHCDMCSIHEHAMYISGTDW